MKVLITSRDDERNMWFNEHVGEAFDLTGVIDGIPKQYRVDVSMLVERGELAESCRGIAYVPAAFCKVIDGEQPVSSKSNLINEFVLFLHHTRDKAEHLRQMVGEMKNGHARDRVLTSLMVIQAEVEKIRQVVYPDKLSL